MKSPSFLYHEIVKKQTKNHTYQIHFSTTISYTYGNNYRAKILNWPISPLDVCARTKLELAESINNKICRYNNRIHSIHIHMHTCTAYIHLHMHTKCIWLYIKQAATTIANQNPFINIWWQSHLNECVSSGRLSIIYLLKTRNPIRINETNIIESKYEREKQREKKKKTQIWIVCLLLLYVRIIPFIK